MILYSFYKNIALVISLFLFNFYNGYSGTTLFESFVMAGWNFFLALPIIAIGIYDTDVGGAVLFVVFAAVSLPFPPPPPQPPPPPPPHRCPVTPCCLPSLASHPSTLCALRLCPLSLWAGVY